MTKTFTDEDGNKYRVLPTDSAIDPEVLVIKPIKPATPKYTITHELNEDILRHQHFICIGFDGSDLGAARVKEYLDTVMANLDIWDVLTGEKEAVVYKVSKPDQKGEPHE